MTATEQERAQLLCRMLMGGNPTARAQAAEAIERACKAEAELQAAQEREQELLEEVEAIMGLADDFSADMAEDAPVAAKRFAILGSRLDALAAQRTEEIEHRKGVAEVYSHDGRYLGCIGEERWHELVAAERTEEPSE